MGVYLYFYLIYGITGEAEENLDADSYRMW
jgi:hypothetical protein